MREFVIRKENSEKNGILMNKSISKVKDQNGPTWISPHKDGSDSFRV